MLNKVLDFLHMLHFYLDHSRLFFKLCKFCIFKLCILYKFRTARKGIIVLYYNTINL